MFVCRDDFFSCLTRGTVSVTYLSDGLCEAERSWKRHYTLLQNSDSMFSHRTPSASQRVKHIGIVAVEPRGQSLLKTMKIRCMV